MPNGACYRTFGMVLSMYKVDVFFNKDHKLSILQIAGEKIIQLYILTIRVYRDTETSFMVCAV